MSVVRVLSLLTMKLFSGVVCREVFVSARPYQMHLIGITTRLGARLTSGLTRYLRLP